jgi:hypothetical protein
VGSTPTVPVVCAPQRPAAARGFEARTPPPGTAERRAAARPGPSSSGSNSERLAPLVFQRLRTCGSLTPIVPAICERQRTAVVPRFELQQTERGEARYRVRIPKDSLRSSFDACELAGRSLPSYPLFCEKRAPWTALPSVSDKKGDVTAAAPPPSRAITTLVTF